MSNGELTAEEVQALQIELLTERIAELEGTTNPELARDDIGWRRLQGEGEREFSREGLQEIIKRARLFALHNPLIRRAVWVQAVYVWGQGVTIQGRHPDVHAVIEAFLADKKNQQELTSHQARTTKEVELQTDANLFFVLFTNPFSGRVRVRTIAIDEITDIITNPDDAKDVWYYKREWIESTLIEATGRRQPRARIAYYPDFRHRPPRNRRPDLIGEHSVHWDSPVYHAKVGGRSDMRFGVPEIYAALDWARAYRESLENDAARDRALTRFALTLTTKGGSRAVGAARDKLNSARPGATETGAATTPPAAGSTFVQNDAVKLQAMQVSGATMPTDHGRPLRLMVASATGTPDTILSGDVDVGNFATSKTLDRPTELEYHNRQVWWADTLQDIFEYVIEQAVRAPAGPLRGIARVEVDALHGEERLVWNTDPETGEPIDAGVDITFPDILEHDIEARITSIIQAATLDGKAPAGTMPMRTLAHLLLNAVGVEDVDGVLTELFPEDEDPEDGGGDDPPEPQREGLLVRR